MERSRQTVAYLDTHVIVWLYAGEVSRLSEKAKEMIEAHELYFSPLVELELKYLHEIKKITVDASDILKELSASIGLKTAHQPFSLVINQALKISWTRDLFDRLITAEAAINHDVLITCDKKILQHYAHAVW
jgi:PIN domain nuclease of toxin-antitoxin system